MTTNIATMDKIVSLCKRRGFIFPGSEIYGGLANTWDYGPLGAELKNNIKRYWWKTFVHSRIDMVGLDCAILMNPKVWEASGHVTSFSDPLVDCKKCKERFRGDKLVEEKTGQSYPEVVISHIQPWIDNTPVSDSPFSKDEALKLIELTKKDQSKLLMECLPALIKYYKIVCPSCGKSEFTLPRSFNLMFKTFQGVIEDQAEAIYLRPETAQGIFVNFKSVQLTTRKKLPFGIAQIGKSFRNEITPGNFTFRTREFEQMEIEYFIKPGKFEDIFNDWCEQSFNWYLSLGVKPENLRFRQHTKEELSHYSSLTKDIEYKFPFGWGELEGIAYRSDYDLCQHTKFSGEDINYLDPETNQKYVPHVIEPSFGVDRSLLTVLLDAYHEEEVNNELRVVMKFAPIIAPVKLAILPLSNQLSEKGREIYDQFNGIFNIDFDTSGSIGKRYRRQDEIGTPYCVTVDFDTLNDQSVTIRERDSMKQERVKIVELRAIMMEKLRV